MAPSLDVSIIVGFVVVISSMILIWVLGWEGWRDESASDFISPLFALQKQSVFFFFLWVQL